MVSLRTDAAGTAPPPRVAALVLNWNSGAETVACVAALRRQTYPACDVLVADNGSTDASRAEIGAAFPDVPLLALDANLGYAGGNNRAIERMLAAGCAYVWLLNPDVRVAPDALAVLLDAAERRPAAAFLGPKVYMRDAPSRILSAGGVLDDGCIARHRGLGEPDVGQYDTIADVAFVTGCAVLARASAIAAIGLLDESFFLYHEEVDWCRRAHAAGYAVLYVPGAHVWHPDTRARDANSPRVTYYIARNTLRFAAKHRLGRAVTARLVTRYLRTAASWSVRPMWRHKRAQRNALLRALGDFAAGRAGECPALRCA